MRHPRDCYENLFDFFNIQHICLKFMLSQQRSSKDHDVVENQHHS